MEFHEAADIFPLMTGAAFDELVRDIAANGVTHPIVIHDGRILDGRNRYRAAQKAGKECPQVEWAGQCGDPVAYVVTSNLHRRQLNHSQRAMCAARARAIFDRMAKERQRKGQERGREAQSCPLVAEIPPTERAKARDQAGKAFGVSGKLVDAASHVLKHGTEELKKAVDDGRMYAQTAAVLAHEPEERQREEAESGRRHRKYTSDNGKGKSRATPKPAAGQKRKSAIRRLIDDALGLANKSFMEISPIDLRKVLKELRAELARAFPDQF